jgi:hypothetical protein
MNSHSISDHTQTNWNGVVGQIFLEARPKIFIQNIQVFPDIYNKQINAKIRVDNTSGEKVTVSLQLKADGHTAPASQTVKFELSSGENVLHVDYPMGEDVQLWNEFIRRFTGSPPF